MRRVVLLLGLLFVAGGVEGCASSRTRAPAAPRTILEVDNQGFADMTIYVVSGGQRIRLGLATGKTTSRFTVPATVVGTARELSFLADPVGSSRSSISEQLFVRAGETVTLVIRP